MTLLETVTVFCPYCGEQNELVVDKSVPQQEYIEDCFVCCRPMGVSVEVGDGGELSVAVRSEDE
jgi:hypothetical protein